jgi:hypothetical protein
MWQVGIEVISSEVDPTPVNEYWYQIDNVSKSLIILCKNQGWGDAVDASLYISEPHLDLLYPRTSREYRGTIRSGSEERIAVLNPSTLQSEHHKLIQTMIDRRMAFYKTLATAVKRGDKSVLKDDRINLLLDFDCTFRD